MDEKKVYSDEEIRGVVERSIEIGSATLTAILNQLLDERNGARESCICLKAAARGFMKERDAVNEDLKALEDEVSHGFGHTGSTAELMGLVDLTRSRKYKE